MKVFDGCKTFLNSSKTFADLKNRIHNNYEPRIKTKMQEVEEKHREQKLIRMQEEKKKIKEKRHP